MSTYHTASRREAPPLIEPGSSTAAPANVAYRIGKIVSAGVVRGTWLDCGCADGSYARALVRAGAKHAIGVDSLKERIEEARLLFDDEDSVEFVCAASECLSFESNTFDGVLLNEVLEHVADETRTLAELRRVLRPSGRLAVFSPNRWFPFEGHGLRFGKRQFPHPAPFVPWLPEGLTVKIRVARNYWPEELIGLVESAGFRIVKTESVFPVLEFYPWLPARLIPWYQRRIPMFERTPFLRNFGVSTFVLGEK